MTADSDDVRVHMMSRLKQEDVLWLLRRMPAALRQFAEQDALGGAFLKSVKLYVAGGFIRSVIAGEPINDVDVFTDSVGHANQIAARLAKLQSATVLTTPNALTVRSADSNVPAIQIIHRWVFDDLRTCVDSFDFSIARAGLAYSPDGGWWSFCDEDFYPDLAAKRLRYRAPDRREDEAGSMLRMLKFYGRGYRAPLLDIAAVTARAVKGIHAERKRDWIDWVKDEDEEQEACAFVLGRLRVIDPSADPEDEGHLG